MTRFPFTPSREPFKVLQGGVAVPRRGRPRKTTDAVAQQKVADIEKLRDLGIDFAKNLMTGQVEFKSSSGRTEILEGVKLTYLGSTCLRNFLSPMKMKSPSSVTR